MAEFVRTKTTTLSLNATVVYGGAAVRAYKAQRWPNLDLIASLGDSIVITSIGVGGLFQVLW